MKMQQSRHAGASNVVGRIGAQPLVSPNGGARRKATRSGGTVGVTTSASTIVPHAPQGRILEENAATGAGSQSAVASGSIMDEDSDLPPAPPPVGAV